MHRHRFAIPLAVSLLLLTAASAQGTATFEGLGDLPGGSHNGRGNGISRDGLAVAGFSADATGQKAVRVLGGLMLDLGFLGTTEAASNHGAVLAGWATNPIEAVRWENGSALRLGHLPGGGFPSYAFGVSADGSVVVGYSYHGNPAGDEAFIWSGGSLQGLGQLPGGNFDHSRAYNVSDDGTVVVGQSLSASGYEAFRWEAGSMQGLGDLPGGAFHSRAEAVSQDGSVIVGQSSVASGSEAVRWSGGTISGLGDLPGGSHISIAWDVSADGGTVVGGGNTALGWEAFIWDSTSGMRNLKQVLESEHGLDLTGWTLSAATGISNDGFAISGWGVNPSGNTEGWIARFSRKEQITNSGGCGVGHTGQLTPRWGCFGHRNELVALSGERLELHCDPGLFFELRYHATPTATFKRIGMCPWDCGVNSVDFHHMGGCDSQDPLQGQPVSFVKTLWVSRDYGSNDDTWGCADTCVNPWTGEANPETPLYIDWAVTSFDMKHALPIKFVEKYPYNVPPPIGGSAPACLTGYPPNAEGPLQDLYAVNPPIWLNAPAPMTRAATSSFGGPVITMGDNPYAPCDLDQDGDCDALDATLFDGVMDACEGQATYWPMADQDRSGCVNALDRFWLFDLDEDDDGVPNAGDNCTTTSNPNQLDGDADGFGDACDCAPITAATFPGAMEINDGQDNQCPGQVDSGIADEISFDAGFHDAGDKQMYSWTAQPGATEYTVARSTIVDFSSDCVAVPTTGTLWQDSESPLPSEAFYYLARPQQPNTGSWGQSSSGVERLDVCVSPQ